jgi:hypothetical protein
MLFINQLIHAALTRRGICLTKLMTHAHWPYLFIILTEIYLSDSFKLTPQYLKLNKKTSCFCSCLLQLFFKIISLKMEWKEISILLQSENRISDFTKNTSICLLIQINQPTRCKSFTSLLLDVYMWLNMFRPPPRPSSGAYNCTRSLWFYRWREAVGALLVVVCQTTTNNAPTASL